MKQKLANVKKTVSDNKVEIAFFATVAAAMGAIVYLGVKEEQRHAEMVSQAVAAGKTVLETPWGTAII